MFKFRRRQYLIDKKYQWSFVMGGMIYIAAIAVCLSLPFIPLINSLNVLLVDVPTEVADMVRRQQGWVMTTFVLCSLWLIAAWTIFAIFRSHKIAGPAYNIVQTMKKVVSGDTAARVRLRTKDDLQPVADAVNEAMDSWVAREESTKQRLREFLRREQSAMSTEQVDRAIAHAWPKPAPSKPNTETADDNGAAAELEKVTS